MSGVHTRSAPTPLGATLGTISNDLVRLHKATCGKGPDDAVAYLAPGTLVCIMRGGLSTAERSLVQHGHIDQVRAQRDLLHTTMGDDARSIVERALDASVATLLYSCDPRDEVEALVFVLARGDYG